VAVQLGEERMAVDVPLSELASAPTLPEPEPAPWTDEGGAMVDVPLVRLAWGRSGDKGDVANIGLVARRPELLALLWARVTPEAVRHWLGHLVNGRIERHALPGLDAMNLVLHLALDGGGAASTRNDPLGKGMAQMLLEMPVAVPAAWAQELDGG
jgi:hypothetical protein